MLLKEIDYTTNIGYIDVLEVNRENGALGNHSMAECKVEILILPYICLVISQKKG